ncbi:MAG TPA: DinB family protein [Gemmatimonadaceae bacterium]|nr:DinB family protein [Gemmatimonadaceae bacterium]
MRTPAEVLAQLARGPDMLRAIVADVPAADLKRRPLPEKWSAHEHACHLALMEPMWAARAERILTEDVPTIVSYEPDADEAPDKLLGMELAGALDTYAHGRRQFVHRLEGLPASAWERRAVHTAHARYSLFLMCRHVALHDMLHSYRIEESVLGTHWATR